MVWAELEEYAIDLTIFRTAFFSCDEDAPMLNIWKGDATFA